MEHESLTLVLSLAFGFGLLHALDADHVMAVTGLASTRPSLRSALSFCVRWALGHGLSLLFIGAVVLFLGASMPASLSVLAERLVAVVLAGIGVWILWELYGRGVHIHFHRHEGLPLHAHWHGHEPGRASAHDATHHHRHGAVLVGVLHGTAGSAPLLALIPVARLESPWVGLVYLLLFCAGVLFSMLFCGGLLGGVFTWLSRFGQNAVKGLRTAVAVASIALGVHLMFGGA